MSLRLVIPKQEVRHLSALRDLSRELLERLLTHLRGLGPTLEAAAFETEVTSIIGDARPLDTMRALVTLSSVARTHGATPEELMGAVSADLENRLSENDWTEKDLEKWRDVAPLIEQLVAVESVAILEKALELGYAFSNLLRTARILTDVRPVFDEMGENLRAAVITQTLEIAYLEDGRARSIRFALDEKDLSQLIRSCTRARAKIKTTRRHMEDVARLRVTVAGEEEDDDASA